MALVSYSLNIGDATLRSAKKRNELGLQASGRSLGANVNLPASFIYAKATNGVVTGDLLWFEPTTGLASKGTGIGMPVVAIVGSPQGWFVWLLRAGLVEVQTAGNIGDLVYSDGISLTNSANNYSLLNSFYLTTNIIFIGE